MNKPVKPRAPSKREKPPSKYTLDQKYLNLNATGKNINLEYSLHSFDDLSLSREALLDLLNENPELVSLNIILDHAPYGEAYDAPSIAVVANLRKENEDYESQLDYYNRRFEIYEAALKKYEQDLAKYKTWLQESRDKEEKARQELKNSIRAKLTPEEMKFLKKEIDYV